MNANAPYQVDRMAVFDRLWNKYNEAVISKADLPITISLPDGTSKSGIAFKTTPLDIALGISKGLADAVIIAKVVYTNRFEDDHIVACDEDEEAIENKQGIINDTDGNKGELWDLNRPLVGDCIITLLKFEDPEAKTVFWHSSAHVLGAAIEGTFGAHLTIGPPLQSGFYYDSYMGELTVHDEDLKKVIIDILL